MSDAPGDADQTPPASEGTYLRTTFLDVLAHELRGPAGVTLGAIDELEQALSDGAKEYTRLFAMARRGVRRVLRSADRLSRTAQLEQVGPALECGQLELNGLVERSIRDAEQSDARKSVSIDFKRCAQPAVVRADANWLGAAISELVGAALRAARRSVAVELQEHADRVRLIVCDDGPWSGTPSLRRFEPSEDRRDAGLAFPLVQQVVVAHGGELTMRTGEIAGLLVVVALPKA